MRCTAARKSTNWCSEVLSYRTVRITIDVQLYSLLYGLYKIETIFIFFIVKTNYRTKTDAWTEHEQQGKRMNISHTAQPARHTLSEQCIVVPSNSTQ